MIWRPERFLRSQRPRRSSVVKHAVRRIGNKTLKQNALKSHPGIAPHIPPSMTYSKANLIKMLNTHRMVYVKPNRGSHGNGVMRVEKYAGGYKIHVRKTVHTTKTINGLVQLIARHKMKRPYIIQKGIYLLKIRGSYVDYRVKYVKEGGRWKYLAVVARVARKGLAVTNLNKGGNLLRGMHALRLTVGSSTAAGKKREMKRLTEKCTTVLINRFPGLSRLGYDYGIDVNGKIWILEVNTNPE